ncbi:transposase [Listeria monocytogenes]|nr:hypothetical protein [Listeria monocytogenes]EDN7386647.1 transposase [Listeria monocytogenes]
MKRKKHPVYFASKQLEVHENTLYRWVSEYEKHGNQSFPENGNREFASQKEVKRLEIKFQVFLERGHR